MLNAIEADSRGRPVSIAIVPDYPEFSRSNIRYAATLRHLPYRFGRAWEDSPLGSEYVVVKTGDQGPEFSARKARRAMEAIAKPGGGFHRAFATIGTFPLPTGDHAVIFRRDIQPTRARAEEIIDRLKKSLDSFMPAYARNVVGFRAEVASGLERLRTGTVERLVVRAERAEVGDFRPKPAAIVLENVRVELGGMVFNPHTLMDEGRLEVLDLTVVKIQRLSVTEQAIRAYLQSDPKLRGITVVLQAGVADAEIRRGGLRAFARISARSVDGLIDVDVLETSLWGLRVPRGIVKSVAGGVDPERRLEELPVDIRVDSLSIQNGRIEIGL